MKSKHNFLFLVYLLLMFAAPFPLFAELTATATLNVQSFPVDRAAQLSISVNGVRSFQPQMPEVEGLRFHPRGQSTQVQIINGDYSSSVTSSYLVEASHSGTFTIPPIRISSGKGEAETAAIQFEVTGVKTASGTKAPKPGTAPATRLRSGEAEEVAFMRLIPAKKTSYSGEELPVQIKVYFREGIKANLNSLPQLAGEGFILQQLGREPQQTQEVVGNNRYSVLTWNSALSGIKEGKHSISVELDATLLLRQQRQRVQRPRGMFSDPFFGDSFFDDFFGSYREKEVKVASPKMEVEVKSLPEEGKPEHFSGAIGDFSLQVEADPLKISKGDPVRLTMSVSGQGNFDRVQAPQLQTEEGWKTYTPSSEFVKDGNDHEGRKVFEQALVAKAGSLTEIPAVKFSYFDPVSGEYKDLVSSPIPLKVHDNDIAEKNKGSVEEKAAEVPKAPMQKVQETVEQAIPGLAPLRLDPGDMSQKLEPLFMKRWFQIFCAVLLLAILAAVTFKIRVARLANNPRLLRQQKMKHLLSQREKEIDERLAAGDSRGFLTVCRSAIQEQLGLDWEMEAAVITLADLKSRLADDSVLLAIFSAAEESAYSGRELNSRQMKEFADGMKKELEALI